MSHTADSGGEPAGSCTGDGTLPIPRTVDAEMRAAFAKVARADMEWAHGPEGMAKGQGSNWFVVGSKGSATGKPLLPNPNPNPNRVVPTRRQVSPSLLAIRT